MILLKKTTKYLLLVSLVIFSCTKNNPQSSIHGLWVVNNVSFDKNSTTPVSRWIRFHEDGTQESGNGWLQHSYGKWNITQNKLSITDENGLKDNAGSFAFSILKESMTWKRIEEGKEVTITLIRAKNIPQSEGNKLFGLWKLTDAKNKNQDIFTKMNPKNNFTLFLRWDQVFVEQNLPNPTRTGIFKVHAQKPEIQLVNYGPNPQFSFWSFDVSSSNLRLTSSNGETVLEFTRIYEFLN